MLQLESAEEVCFPASFFFIWSSLKLIDSSIIQNRHVLNIQSEVTERWQKKKTNELQTLL